MPEQVRRKKKGSKSKPQQSSSGLYLGIASAVVLAGVIAGAAVALTNRSRGNASSSTTPGTTSPLNSTAGAANTSTNATTAQTVHVPSISSDAQPLQDERTVDDQGRFDLRLPVGWKREPDPKFHASPDTEKMDPGPERHRQPGLSVIPSPQLTRTLQSLAEQTLEPYRKSNLPILANQSAKISGYDARRFIFESDVSPQMIDAFGLTAGEKYRTLYYIIGPVNGTFLLVIMQAHNDNGRFEKLLPTFEAMMSTFRIPAGGEKRAD